MPQYEDQPRRWNQLENRLFISLSSLMKELNTYISKFQEDYHSSLITLLCPVCMLSPSSTSASVGLCLTGARRRGRSPRQTLITHITGKHSEILHRGHPTKEKIGGGAVEFNRLKLSYYFPEFRKRCILH